MRQSATRPQYFISNDLRSGDLASLVLRVLEKERAFGRTPQRLRKLANTLAALTRNAKRRDLMGSGD